MMLDELRKVIPSFLQRVDRPDRGGDWSAYLDADAHDRPAIWSRRCFPDLVTPVGRPELAARPACRR